MRNLGAKCHRNIGLWVGTLSGELKKLLKKSDVSFWILCPVCDFAFFNFRTSLSSLVIIMTLFSKFIAISRNFQKYSDDNNFI